MTARILVVDDSPVILKVVSQALGQAEYQVLTAPNGPAGLQQVDSFKPDLVILDVMMPELDGYQVCRELRRQPVAAAIPVMLLTAQEGLEEKVKGSEAGADDYVTKPFDAVELQARVKALLRRAGPPETGGPARTLDGKIIAVFSLRGGAGVSTVAANLAAGLAQLWSAPTALVDLALTGGHGALMFNLTPHATWAEIARRPLEEIDSDLLDQVLAVHSSGVNVLAAPRRPEQAEQLTPDKVSAVLTLLRSRHPYIVLDLPHDFHELTVEGLDKADQILFLIVPELGSIVNAALGFEIFNSLGYAETKLRLALNQLFERRYVVQADIESALQRQVQVAIPYAQSVLVPAINRGTPAVLAWPDSEVGALFEDLAFYLSTEAHRSQPPSIPSVAWSRVAKRAQSRKK
jgi:pilus assembly protein CpaE